MVIYSLHAVASRPAEVAETLVSSKFQETTTRGFASPDNPLVAVCLRPGTEMAFENNVQAIWAIIPQGNWRSPRAVSPNRPRSRIASSRRAGIFERGNCSSHQSRSGTKSYSVLISPANLVEQRAGTAQSAPRHSFAE